MSIDPNVIQAKLVDAGADWADLDAAASLLEETRKIVLAEAMQDFEGSVAAREAKALASDPYRSHIERMVEARRLANRAKVKYCSIQAWIELRRSVEATRRVEAALT